MKLRRSRAIGLLVIVGVLLMGLSLGPVLADQEPEGKGSFFCRNGEATHPVGKAIASLYGEKYEDVMEWFCEGQIGFGQIMLALQTAKTTETSAEDLLEKRAAGMGWGEIWQEAGLIGQARAARTGSAEGAEEPGPPKGVGKPEAVEKLRGIGRLVNPGRGLGRNR